MWTLTAYPLSSGPAAAEAGGTKIAKIAHRCAERDRRILCAYAIRLPTPTLDRVVEIF
jgi:hypothetical protein